MSNINQIWYFIGLAGFIFVNSWLFFAVMSYLHTFALDSEQRHNQLWKIENRE